MDDRLPVTILTGYLGSGKTTLLNWILTADHGMKIAVIENEFGEVGIDDSLIRSKVKSDEQIVEMNNGCICCTVRVDLICALEELAKRKSEIDLILIETTGLADPGPVCQTFFMDEDVQALAKLDSVITVVDCKHILMHLDEEKPEGVTNESYSQLAFADRILLNKTDLVSEEELEEIISRVTSITAAPYLKTTLKDNPVPMEFLLGIEAFSLDSILETVPNFLTNTSLKHDQAIGSIGFELPGNLSVFKFQQMISALLQIKGNDLLRYKGILSMRGSDNKFVFQGVHMLLDGDFAEETWETTERVNKLVFIGRNLDREFLFKAFNDCIVDDNAPLRFLVGDQILANTEDGWIEGTIIAVWDDGNPYRIKVNNTGEEIWAPEDEELFVREIGSEEPLYFDHDHDHDHE